MTNEDTKNRRGIVVVPTAIVARWVQTTTPGPVRAVVYFMAAPADKRRRREREGECPYVKGYGARHATMHLYRYA